VSKNGREFFRVTFDQFLEGEIFIQKKDSLPIQIENLSVAGVKFLSPTDIPLDEKVECSFTILDESFLIEGAVIRKTPLTEHIEYALEFEVDRDVFSTLFKQLNYYQIRLRKGELETSE
jgi:hypothetical protein